MVTLGTRDEAFGQVWHLPSAETLTTRQFVTLVYEATGHPVKLSGMPSPMLSIAALVSPMLRAVKEQQYQRERPWVVDHSKFAHAFGARVTAHREAIALSLAWWQRAEQSATSQPATRTGSRSV